jgi:predicted HAD superfamily Cof-like phosphohydrolase
MNKLQLDVGQFHKAFGHPAPEFPVEAMTPAVADLLRKRAAWLHEEATELEEACDEGDLVKAVDALGDSIYFGVGGFVVLGHDMMPFWGNIQGANMAKLGADGKPIIRESDGKVMKPEGWVPPEPLHKAYIDEVRRRTAIESMARQLAYAAHTNPGHPVTLSPVGMTPSDLLAVADRCQMILGGRQAEALYQQMVDEIGEF